MVDMKTRFLIVIGIVFVSFAFSLIWFDQAYASCIAENEINWNAVLSESELVFTGTVTRLDNYDGPQKVTFIVHDVIKGEVNTPKHVLENSELVFLENDTIMSSSVNVDYKIGKTYKVYVENGKTNQCTTKLTAPPADYVWEPGPEDGNYYSEKEDIPLQQYQDANERKSYREALANGSVVLPTDSPKLTDRELDNLMDELFSHGLDHTELPIASIAIDYERDILVLWTPDLTIGNKVQELIDEEAPFVLLYEEAPVRWTHDGPTPEPEPDSIIVSSSAYVNSTFGFSPQSDYRQAFDDAKYVIVGKILSVEILSEPDIQVNPNIEEILVGIALYEIEVEVYWKKSPDTDVIKIPGYYINEKNTDVEGIDLLYNVDEKVLLYIQSTDDVSDELTGYDLIIRSQESQSLNYSDSRCTEPNTFYHKEECREIPNCSPGTVLAEGVCVVIDLNDPRHNTDDCFIATASYGSDLAPQVQMLREIRNNVLLSTYSGTLFMNGFNTVYYSFSPEIANMENENPILKEAVRIFITPMVTALSIMTLAQEGSEFQVILFGISTIGLIIGMYVVAPVTLVWKIQVRK